MSERGVVKNENAVVTSLVSKDEVQAAEIDELMEKTFEGSIPAFIAAFTKQKRYSLSKTFGVPIFASPFPTAKSSFHRNQKQD